MNQGSYSKYTICPTDLKALRSDCVSFLSGQSFAIRSNVLSKTEFKIEAVRGGMLFALLAQMVPGFDIIGIGSRVKVMIRCRKEKGEESEKYILQLRCEPIQEFSDNKENFWVGQPGGEYIGDHLKSNKWFEKVKSFLQEKGYLDFQ